MPVISIITSVYDAKECLPACIQSVLNQTFADFELILVEDGSPNGCGEVCDEWAKGTAAFGSSTSRTAARPVPATRALPQPPVITSALWTRTI